MDTVLLALAIGVVAGLRAMIVPTAIAWAARLAVLDLGDSWLRFLGNAWVPWLVSALAIGELVTDQLPSTPSRTLPVQFSARLVMGAVAGAAIGVGGDAWIAGASAGAAGAVIGTLGGRVFRARLARWFGRDRPAAVIEDVVAIAGALLVMAGLR